MYFKSRPLLQKGKISYSYSLSVDPFTEEKNITFLSFRVDPFTEGKNIIFLFFRVDPLTEGKEIILFSF